jgi:hypothetical protein
MIPRFDTLSELKLNKEMQKEARKYIQKLKEVTNIKFQEHNKWDEVNNKRPPNLWNHPDIPVEKHNYRSIAAPNECYVDGRIQKFEEILQVLTNHIVSNKLL